ncbi:MAG TPA: cupin domain-containing protein [Ignavibacteriaceae bacterium]|nr:cupin domain-containing protein [Ignavibacteriaceae bacterium]
MTNRYYLIVFSTIFFLIIDIKAQTNVPIKFDSTNYSMENCVNTFTLDGIEKIEAGYQYWFADKNFLDGRTIELSVVNPHSATHKPHTHFEDEFFFILEGTADFYLNGETKVVSSMTSLYCPSFSEHGIKNVGDTELKYLVIKKYEVK